jgi:hypothetical protein
MPGYPFRNSEAIVGRLEVLHDTVGLSWPKIATETEFLPIPAGTLCSIYHGYPIPMKWRVHLGLPAKKVVIACRTCGEAHVTKRCTKNIGSRPRRIAIRLDDPESAAKSIMKHMDKESLEGLLDLIMSEVVRQDYENREEM